MQYAKICGTGSYLPEKCVTNKALEKVLDTSDAWIFERTGIRARHIAEDNETASSMGTLAARRALEMAKIEPETVDLIIVATSTPDRVFPSTACLIQKNLGLRRAAAFDISAACAGFSYAFSVADQYIKTGFAKTILVVGSELGSRTVDWRDRSTCILFGDGAGAVILTASEKPGIHSTHLHADGTYEDILLFPNDAASPSLKTDSPYVRMSGRDVFKIAVQALESMVGEVMSASGFSLAQIDWLIPHQANRRIIEAVAKKLSLPMEKVILTLETQGNTSSASVPLALDYAIRTELIKPGHLLLLESIGGGMVWGSALVTY